MSSTAWLVIAGGLGVRYGEPKYAAVHQGSTFLDRCLATVGAAAATSDTVMVALRPGQPWVPSEGVRLIHDDPRAHGPLAGLLAGIEAVHRIEPGHRPHTLVTLPVDMPDLTTQALADLRESSQRLHGLTVARSRESGDMHWPLAAYTVDILESTQNMILEGRRSLRDIATGLGYVSVPLDDAEARNVNHRPS